MSCFLFSPDPAEKGGTCRTTKNKKEHPADYSLELFTIRTIPSHITGTLICKRALLFGRFNVIKGLVFSFLSSLPCGMRSLFLRGQQKGKLIVSLRPLRLCGEYRLFNSHLSIVNPRGIGLRTLDFGHLYFQTGQVIIGKNNLTGKFYTVK